MVTNAWLIIIILVVGLDHAPRTLLLGRHKYAKRSAVRPSPSIVPLRSSLYNWLPVRFTRYVLKRKSAKNPSLGRNPRTTIKHESKTDRESQLVFTYLNATGCLWLAFFVYIIQVCMMIKFLVTRGRLIINIGKKFPPFTFELVSLT
jgi:hypothetical protein